MDLVVDCCQGIVRAERGAHEGATPAAEPLADEEAVWNVGNADDGAERGSVACVGCGYGFIEGVLVVEELAQSLPGGLQLCHEVGYGDFVDATDPAAHEAVADDADPVAKEMAVGSELEFGDEVAEAGAVALVQDLRELSDEIGGGGEAHDGLGQQARIGVGDGFGRAAEFKAEEDTFLAADPLADEAAKRKQAELGEGCLEGSRICDAECVVEGGEGLLVLADLGDGCCALDEVTKDV